MSSAEKKKMMLLPESTTSLATLYKKEALLRSEKIDNVSYRLVYAMLPGGKTFRGQVEISFNLKETLNDGSMTEWAFLDYKGAAVHWVTNNGKDITGSTVFKDDRIYLCDDNLPVGTNKMVINFESTYVRDCQGVHYFKDPEDGEEYLYS